MKETDIRCYEHGCSIIAFSPVKSCMAIEYSCTSTPQRLGLLSLFINHTSFIFTFFLNALRLRPRLNFRAGPSDRRTGQGCQVWSLHTTNRLHPRVHQGLAYYLSSVQILLNDEGFPTIGRGEPSVHPSYPNARRLRAAQTTFSNH